MKVGIRFSDNDFTSNCIKPFMDLFVIPTFKVNENGHIATYLTSSMIVELFNTHVPYIYRWVQFQNHQDWYESVNNIHSLYDIPLNKDYFSITEQDVYWDDKSDEYIENWSNNNNHEFVYTDGKKVYIS